MEHHGAYYRMNIAVDDMFAVQVLEAYGSLKKLSESTIRYERIFQSKYS